ncbi:MAG: putative sulfate/molybdate transporter [Elusimicrobiota bacterium]|nr:putative sulfate/molybdate transporter [Elusimicrobiota bacterium]
MKKQSNSKIWPDFRFNAEEIAGAIGDYGTLIPIVLGVAIVSNVNLGYTMLFFSFWYIVTGIYYKMPVPVEPMKAIGALVIAEGMSGGEIAASGIMVGILFFALGLFKGMKFIQEKVPQSVIRGIQLGLALLLIKTSINFIIGDYILAIICISIIVLFLMANKFGKIPDVSSICILLIGIIVGFSLYGIPRIRMISMPNLIIPTLQDFLRGGWLLAIPQVPLTIANAILATTLLMQDLVHRDVDPDKLSVTIGLMNLTAVPFGGFPMCHGAGGLAAQYRFGARTGGSNIISGLILLPIALFLASPEFVAIIPFGVFGALLVFVAIELGRHSIKTDSYLITGIIAILALVINMTVAFIVGMILAYIWTKIRSRPKGV